MPRMPNSLEVVKTDSVPVFQKMAQKLWQRTAVVVNGNLSLGDGANPDNIAGAWANVTTPAVPNTDFFITHNLGAVPVGYQVHQKSTACDVYNGSQPWNSTRICLRASVGNVALRLFIPGSTNKSIPFSPAGSPTPVPPVGTLLKRAVFTPDNVTQDWVLPATPAGGVIILAWNGLIQAITTSYTLAGVNIHTIFTASTGDTLEAYFL